MGSSLAYAPSAVMANDNGLSKGRHNEQRVLQALNDTTWQRPHWLNDCRLALPKEDARGVDLVLFTATGIVCLQIKSSWIGALKFWQRYYPTKIGLIVVNPLDTPGVLRRKVLAEANIIRSHRYHRPRRCWAHRAFRRARCTKLRPRRPR